MRTPDRKQARAVNARDLARIPSGAISQCLNVQLRVRQTTSTVAPNGRILLASVTSPELPPSAS